MKRQILTVILCSIFITSIKSQSLLENAESIRKEYKIPELAYAVVSQDSILEIQTLGYKRINRKFPASLNDRFHIGSNTKAITGFIAALLIKQHKLNWNTKFFDLLPELKSKSNPAYYNLTLEDLLTFRANLPAFSYTNKLPKKRWFKGDYAEQRFQLVVWLIKQKASAVNNHLVLTNAGFIAAELMLERASGKSYKQLVSDLGKELKINFEFDYPNLSNNLQTWGHDAFLKPLPPKENYKLNWLLAAGNINVTLPDYIKFVQLQLKGLEGKSDLLTKEEFKFLHYGLSEFSVGWFWKKNGKNHLVSYNTGNAGAFITEVQVIPEINRAYIVFTNSATAETSKGISILLEKMLNRFGE